MQRFLFFILPVVFISCSEVFIPETYDVEPYLFMEGFYSTQTGNHYVQIYYSTQYTKYPHYEEVGGATVFVSDTLGEKIYYNYSGNGIYKATLTEDNVARFGNKYFLEVITKEGVVYRSKPQLAVPSPEIRNFYCKADESMILTENSYGEILEVQYEGISLIIETKGLLPSDNYYIYDYDAYEEHFTRITDGRGGNSDFFRHRRLNGKYFNIIHTVNADEFGSFIVRGDKLMFIITSDLTNYTPLFPDTMQLVTTRFEGLLFTLRQYSVSPDAYKFFNDAEKQLAAEGHLFDPAFAQLQGNIECIDDPNQKVMGVFYVSDVSTYHAYMYIDGRRRTYSRKIDSIPELWLDTCSWRRPESWIDPPF